MTPNCKGVLFVTFLCMARMVFAQSSSASSSRPEFEVASIKPDKSGDRRIMIAPSPGGRFNATNVPLKILVTLAYGLQDFQISGLPGWAESERFDIVAKAPADVAGEQKLQMQMLQRLLEDRFSLKFRRETKELPVYALVPAKNGRKLHESAEGPCPAPTSSGAPSPPAASNEKFTVPCGAFMNSPTRLNGSRVPMARLAAVLSRTVGRTVVDKTGLTGNYDIDLEWTADSNRMPSISGDGTPGTQAPDSVGPSIFTALQEQLGLRLESQKAPEEVLVVDHVERPSEN